MHHAYGRSSSLEKRSFHRYLLSTPLTGLVEHEGGRFSGNVLNISAGGFFLHLAVAPEKKIVPYGISDYGEIHYAGRNAHGFGQIVRIDNLPSGVGIGFSWDPAEINEGGSALIAEMIEEQVKKRQAGYVSTSPTDISLGGHVSSALASETFACLKKIGASNARLSLRDCLSIDSSGIEMLMTLRDMGVPVAEAGDGIKAVIQRFQLLPGDASTD